MTEINNSKTSREQKTNYDYDYDRVATQGHLNAGQTVINQLLVVYTEL